MHHHEEILPDVLDQGLRVVFCGMAAGELAAHGGAYYAQRNNRFWPTLHDIGLTPQLFKPCWFRDLRDLGIGLTDLVKDQAGPDAGVDATAADAEELIRKIECWKPTVLAFNGRRSAERFFETMGHHDGVHLVWGPQPPVLNIGATRVCILPSTSAANGQWAHTHHLQRWQELAEALPLIAV